jgi:hypothetical protein
LGHGAGSGTISWRLLWRSYLDFRFRLFLRLLLADVRNFFRRWRRNDFFADGSDRSFLETCIPGMSVDSLFVGAKLIIMTLSIDD